MGKERDFQLFQFQGVRFERACRELEIHVRIGGMEETAAGWEETAAGKSLRMGKHVKKMGEEAEKDVGNDIPVIGANGYLEFWRIRLPEIYILQL